MKANTKLPLHQWQHILLVMPLKRKMTIKQLVRKHDISQSHLMSTLKKLEKECFVKKERQDGRSFSYILTSKGESLHRAFAKL